ncbi:methyltransferase [Pontibacillus yanchengensis]|uniref:Methyltransferase n=2 Tax=Pontibacillus yanchengensis TaxID=462910 RepID=A0ACC7VIV5_9BACI|nr:class I SAM-dependent methyltransferase [Pontibacillus yanchengensis]MYL34908.1 methyltransferase [Pontibacillus yanchengensis]MYL54717.1 methyltransferase [Pontibacillus yanchengensis]
MVYTVVQGIVLIVVILSLLSIAYFSIKNGITPTPTNTRVKKEVLSLTKSYQPMKVADFGAGFGTMAFGFAKTFPNARVDAYETSWIPFFLMKARLRMSDHANLYIWKKDFFHVDSSQYDVVFCYLYVDAMTKLRNKASPTRLITHTFALPGHHPEKQVSIGVTPIYVYKMEG